MTTFILILSLLSLWLWAGIGFGWIVVNLDPGYVNDEYRSEPKVSNRALYYSAICIWPYLIYLFVKYERGSTV